MDNNYDIIYLVEFMNRRKMPRDYYALAEKRNFGWIGPEVLNITSKSSWTCEQGHKWKSSYNNIQQGHGCPICAAERRIEQRQKKPIDYHALAKKRGFRWLGPEVPSARTKTKWECASGHHWEARYSSIQSGTGCPVCAHRIPKRSTDYHELAKTRSFVWIGPEVSDTQTKTWWLCRKDHKWKTTYNNIRQGHGCPFCAGKMNKKPNDYYLLAKMRGFRWLGPMPPHVRINTNWECPKGHQWKARYNNIKNGTGCRICGRKERAEKSRYKPDDYHALAEAQGIQWIGSEVPNVRTKTNWKCKHNHCWEATYASVRLCGCPICGRKRTGDQLRLKPNDYHALARNRGFHWLGPEVSNNQTKTKWKCSMGHCWESHYNNIQNGSGCPECVDIVNGALVSKPQRRIWEILGGILNYSYDSYKIDVALLNEMIAVEYDSWYWHGGRREYDILRDRELIDAGWKVLHIKSGKKLPSQQELEIAIARLKAGQEKTEIVLDDWEQGPSFISSQNGEQ